MTNFEYIIFIPISNFLEKVWALENQLGEQSSRVDNGHKGPLISEKKVVWANGDNKHNENPTFVR